VLAYAGYAEDMFADANRLFRDDLYWAALLRYGQAAEAGLDTPVLNYNKGIAHYKAQQYVRARESLLKASESPSLVVYSRYNLGLTAWAQGDVSAALDWFRQAREQDQKPEIRALAAAAMSQIQTNIFVEEEAFQDRSEASELRLDKTAQDSFSLRARVGAGSDSNVFRTPAQSYVDLSDPNQPVVDPLVQSGLFIPVNLSGKYSVNSFDNESFFGAYRYNGRFYQDKQLTNGNEHIHELSVGSEYDRTKERRQTRIFSAFSIAQHEENYYDRDNGGSRSVDGVDIGDRMNYLRLGPEMWFRQSWDRFSVGGRGKAQLWNYEETGVVPSYDHEYLALGLNAQYRFTRTSLLRVTGDVYRRHFSQRPSYELDGSQPPGNDPIKYDYVDLGITARQRITRNMWFGLDYIYTRREDLHAGYNDYEKHSYGFDFHMRANDRFELQASGIYRLYDYANAFAYQNPAAGPKTLERVLGTVIASYRMTQDLTLVGEVRFDDVASNDTRLAYNRMQYSVSVRWEQ
jgi:tetratricopeptide (TPR) repeat protein